MKVMSTVITDQVVAPSSQPSIRDHTTSSIRPEAPDAVNSSSTAHRAWRREGCRDQGEGSGRKLSEP